MTGAIPGRQDLLVRRLRLVGALSELNAQALKLTQLLAGLDMEVLRLQLALKQAPADGELAQDLQGELRTARDGTEALAERQNEWAGRLARAEEEIAEVDRLLAQAMAREGG
ncbi:hypothetical protein [Labrys neptuniae]